MPPYPDIILDGLTVNVPSSIIAVVAGEIRVFVQEVVSAYLAILTPCFLASG